MEIKWDLLPCAALLLLEFVSNYLHLYQAFEGSTAESLLTPECSYTWKYERVPLTKGKRDFLYGRTCQNTKWPKPTDKPIYSQWNWRIQYNCTQLIKTNTTKHSMRLLLSLFYWNEFHRYIDSTILLQMGLIIVSIMKTTPWIKGMCQARPSSQVISPRHGTAPRDLARHGTPWANLSITIG